MRKPKVSARRIRAFMLAAFQLSAFSVIAKASFRVVVLDGREFSVRVFRAENQYLVTAITPDTREWASGSGEARIPASFITSLRQNGTQRRRVRWIVVGMMSAATVAVGAVPSKTYDEHPGRRPASVAFLGGLLIPLGYFVGRSFETPFPEYRPTR